MRCKHEHLNPKRKESERESRSTQSGGRRWIRTTEVTDNRFTVCPLWPLGNSPYLIELLVKNGAGGRIRTPDLLITNQLLYQLSYTSEYL